MEPHELGTLGKAHTEVSVLRLQLFCLKLLQNKEVLVVPTEGWRRWGAQAPLHLSEAHLSQGEKSMSWTPWWLNL